MIFLRLFFEFFKVGLFAVGGGMATFPFLNELGPRTGWFTQSQLADMVAVSESTPGPIGVNMASYVGFTTAGVPGAAVATLGLITPSVIIILLVARVLAAFRGSELVKNIFYGLRPASAGLIAAAGISVAVLSLLDKEAYAASGQIPDLFRWKGFLLAAALLYLTRWCKPTKDLHPVAFIVFAAAAGILFRFAGA
ncbi:MAG: chromate transporter [Clostridia bacterium]|nr:chromate transporter [Clostridia bacterium]